MFNRLPSRSLFRRVAPYEFCCPHQKTRGNTRVFVVSAVLCAAGDAARLTADLEIAKPITVGNNVWIGAGSVVLAGVTIGDNAVIGAGSVVTRDIPSDVVAVGVPCRVMRKITEEDKYRYPLYNPR